jgi:hypothetical protein
VAGIGMDPEESGKLRFADGKPHHADAGPTILGALFLATPLKSLVVMAVSTLESSGKVARGLTQFDDGNNPLAYGPALPVKIRLVLLQFEIGHAPDCLVHRHTESSG